MTHSPYRPRCGACGARPGGSQFGSCDHCRARAALARRTIHPDLARSIIVHAPERAAQRVERDR